MVITDFDINYIAVLVSAIVSMFIGFLWYSPLLFATAWMKESGQTKKDIKGVKKKGMAPYYFAAFIATLLMSFILSYFVQYIAATTFFEGMQAGFWIWLGFIAPVLLGSVLWEGKSFRYYMINVFHYLATLLVMAGILAVWQ
ncbi:MAG: DUF1761 domain-containing protein [Nanoarchaeota archaeon]